MVPAQVTKVAQVGLCSGTFEGAESNDLAVAGRSLGSLTLPENLEVVPKPGPSPSPGRDVFVDSRAAVLRRLPTGVM